ncbi:Replication factor A [Senna tora]|uniref:Replication factor A n=1 Tax=Senna tora TaxID=362788 RepID=A0A834WGP9_9FABA|nr:Replication factor A [Senna tora]
MCKGSNHLITAITPFREDLCVKACVVRLWSVPNNSSNHSPSPSNRLEMILCDSKVSTSMDWYYYACGFCMEELDFENECYYCYNCGKSLSTPSIRFKINVEVVDTSGWARLIIFYIDASNFLMTDASNLLHRECSDDPLKHTILLENLLHKVFLFKISVNEASCVPTPSFEVLTMSWDASLIEKWSDKVLPSADVYMSSTFTNSHSNDLCQSTYQTK